MKKHVRQPFDPGFALILATMQLFDDDAAGAKIRLSEAAVAVAPALDAMLYEGPDGSADRARALLVEAAVVDADFAPVLAMVAPDVRKGFDGGNERLQDLAFKVADRAVSIGVVAGWLLCERMRGGPR
jgi:hypothetical protein